MVLSYLSEKIVSIIFLLAIIAIAGLYFFPQNTLNVIGLVAAGFKPVLSVMGALMDIIIKIIHAVVGVF